MPHWAYVSHGQDDMVKANPQFVLLFEYTVESWSEFGFATLIPPDDGLTGWLVFFTTNLAYFTGYDVENNELWVVPNCHPYCCPQGGIMVGVSDDQLIKLVQPRLEAFARNVLADDDPYYEESRQRFEWVRGWLERHRQ